MKLYEVTFKTWNGSFSDLNSNRMLAVGGSPEDAIRRAKERTDGDARDFRATEISDVMGYKIQVKSTTK